MICGFAGNVIVVMKLDMLLQGPESEAVLTLTRQKYLLFFNNPSNVIDVSVVVESSLIIFANLESVDNCI